MMKLSLYMILLISISVSAHTHVCRTFENKTPYKILYSTVTTYFDTEPPESESSSLAANQYKTESFSNYFYDKTITIIGVEDFELGYTEFTGKSEFVLDSRQGSFCAKLTIFQDKYGDYRVTRK